MIRRTILFDNQCGFALGENSRAPNPYVTWRFNEQDGQRNYFWGHYMNEPDMAERDLLNRAEDYQRRYHVQEVEQAPDKETYLYYSTQRPIDIGTYPNSYFNRPVHMDLGRSSRGLCRRRTVSFWQIVTVPVWNWLWRMAAGALLSAAFPPEYFIFPMIRQLRMRSGR